MNDVERFRKALKFLHKHEGGTNTDIYDRGGITKFGISERQYDELNILDLTKSDADSIYYNDYWKRNKCMTLPANLDVVVFDSSVNCGQSSAAIWLQRSMNILGSRLIADGIIGPLTLREVNKHPTQSIVSGVIAYRLKRYVYLLGKYPEQARYIRGWCNRTSNLLIFSMF